MQLTVAMVSDVFEKVLDGRMTREQANRWAYDVMLKDDDGIVEFSPAAEEDRIWAGVNWLLGADLEIAPRQYFHPEDDIREAWTDMLSGKLQRRV